jgi:hypothetical protein
MSIFTDDEENDEEYYQAGRDVWAEHEAKKRKDPDWFVKKNSIELMRSNPSYTLDAERKRVQKKLEEEAQIKAYRTQFPNVVKTISIIGDQFYGNLFIGEADLLAYQIRNQMKLSGAKQLQGQRIFMDGTQITVNSSFGHDIITINVSQATGEEEPSIIAQKQCNVTFINLPLKVQPMKEPGKIASGEVQGTDFIKTYYLFDVGQCPDCQDVLMEFLFDYLVPLESRHFDAKIENHCIYSLLPPCWGEVIDHGKDAVGDYFIWKAYTETGTYSRTGLGVLDLKMSISDSGGAEICNVNKKVDVDCCQKIDTLRIQEIWWQGWPPATCSPYMNYKGLTICKMPNTGISYSALTDYAVYHSQEGCGGGPLYAIPEVNGDCIPIKWELSGPGGLNVVDEIGAVACYQVAGGDCHSTPVITARDRCGTEYVVQISSCCDGADYTQPYITYTSLVMGCNTAQDLYANGGCGPYSWYLSGGGTLTPIGGNAAVYTSPASNVGCADNPTITITDCCGNNASIQLAVSCSVYGNALELWQNTFCWCCSYNDCSVCGRCNFSQRIWYHWIWDCDGNLISYTQDRPYCDDKFSSSYCWPPPCGSQGWVDCNPNTTAANALNGCCDGDISPWHNFQLFDLRSDAMKAAGCCPLDPLTGLPYPK